MAAVEWFYAKDNKQLGPVSAAELKQLADAGTLRPDDLVWREGMDDWQPARKIKGLFEEAAPPPPSGARPPRPAAPAGPRPALEKSAAVFSRFGEGTGRHLFDILLELVRGQFTAPLIDSTGRLFGACGHYGLYAAVLVLLAFSLLLGIKTNRLDPIPTAIVQAAALLALQYAAGRFSAASDRLVRSTPGRMCSTAFLDCFALLHMLAGLVALLALAILAVKTVTFSLLVPAVAAFIFFEYAAVVAMNPESLGLTITSEAGAGEEAVGILSFLLKLMLRVVRVAFGVGAVWGLVLLVMACGQVFFSAGAPPAAAAAAAIGDAEALLAVMPPAELTATLAAWLLLATAALPLAAYLMFVFGHLAIDVVRAVLSLPGKLDRAAEGREPGSQG